MGHNLIFFGVILTAVIISGCLTAGTPSSPGISPTYPAVTFTDFQPISDRVFQGGNVDLYIRVQNNGYFDAENVQLTIFNCGDINQGDLLSREDDADEEADDYRCNDPIEDFAVTLQRPDFDIGVVGETREEQISFKTCIVNPTTQQKECKEFPEGQSRHTFSARLRYDYLATATRDVAFTTFENLREQGGSVDIGILNAFSTPSPVGLDLNAPGDFIVIDTNNPDPEFSVAVSIENLAGGVVPNKKLHSVNLCFPTTFVDYLSPDGKTSVEIPTGEEIDGPWRFGLRTSENPNCLYLKDDKLSLIGLKRQKLDVPARFKLKAGKVAIQDVVTFTSTMTYPYAIDTKTSVILVG